MTVLQSTSFLNTGAGVLLSLSKGLDGLSLPGAKAVGPCPLGVAWADGRIR